MFKQQMKMHMFVVSRTLLRSTDEPWLPPPPNYAGTPLMKVPPPPPQTVVLTDWHPATQ